MGKAKLALETGPVIEEMQHIEAVILSENFTLTGIATKPCLGNKLINII